MFRFHPVHPFYPCKFIISPQSRVNKEHVSTHLWAVRVYLHDPGA